MPRERPQPPPFEPEWLERSLNRYLAWGLVFMVLLIVGFVAYRVREPSLRKDATRPRPRATRPSDASSSTPTARSAMARTRPAAGVRRRSTRRSS